MENLPKKIYLNIGTNQSVDFKELGEVTWSQDKISKDCVEYVLAEHQARQQLREKTIEELRSDEQNEYYNEVASEYAQSPKERNKEQPVRKTLDECKDEVARKHEAISELDLIGSLIMSRNPEAIQDYVSEVATLYAQAKAVEPQQTLDGWVSVKDGLPEYGKKVLVMGEQKGMNPQMGGAYPCISVRQNLKGTMLEKRAPNHQDENQFQMMAYVTHWMPLHEPPTQTNN